MSDYWLGFLTPFALLLAAASLAAAWTIGAAILRRLGWFLEFKGIADPYDTFFGTRTIHGGCGVWWGTYHPKPATWRAWWFGVGERAHGDPWTDDDFTSGRGVVIGKRRSE